MALFDKGKIEEEYEDEEVKETSSRAKPKSRDFRDLNPKNRKKRKEPKKPWGKKERVFVLLVIMATAGTSGFLALSSRSWKVPGIPRLNFKVPRISLPFMSEETIIIRGGRGERDVSEKIISEVNTMTSKLSGVYGLYVINLDSGFSYGINENEEFEPASLNKLPVMLGLYVEHESAGLDLDTKYTLKGSDKLPGSGSLSSKPTGMVLTYRDLIRYMAKESDNTAFNISRRILGQEKIDNLIKAVGMKNTAITIEDQKTTPADIGLFFQRLYQGGVVSQESRDELLDFLTDTLYEDHLAAGVPDGTEVSHKYGRELHVVNDAGIIFAENSYIAVILSKGIVESEADRVLPAISKIIYESRPVKN